MMNIAGCPPFPFFARDYLNWLRDFRYDPSQVTVSNDNGKLNIRLTGPWREAIMWGSPAAGGDKRVGPSLSFTRDGRRSGAQHAGT